MLALSIQFINGRFHATPWGKHVNEASPEWPPSPWRLLRGFVASWKKRCSNDLDCHPDIVTGLLKKLAVPPSFFLPKATISHTRHFMPWFKKKPDDRTLVFDGFVAIEKTSILRVFWPDVILDDQEMTALKRIVSVIPYLGRSESQVDVHVLDQHQAQDLFLGVNCFPSSGVSSSGDFEPILVLCLDPITAFENEFTPKCERTVGERKSKQIICTPIYDPDWHLCMETLEIHKQGWSDAPGSRWVQYLRQKDCFAGQIGFSQKIRKEMSKPTLAYFALDANVLPLVEDTLKIAEFSRRTLMGVYRRIEEKRQTRGLSPLDGKLPKSVVFSGKDSEGIPLHGHEHAHYLPLDEDGDGRIDHVVVYADMGFGPSEIKAIDEFRLLKRDEGEPIHVVLLALGQREILNLPNILGPSRTWVSVTPFITTRYQKKYGQKKDPPELIGVDNQRAFAAHVLTEEIKRHVGPEWNDTEFSVEALNAEHRIGRKGLRPIQFKRYRNKRSDDGGRRPSGAFRITFSEEITGPVCFGHSSHFGMGLFLPETPE